MGGSHSVYILMRINIHHTGKALLNYSARLRRTVATTDLDDVDETADISPLGGDEEPDMLADEDWVTRQCGRRSDNAFEDSQYTVDQWCQAVRETKREDTRVLVVVHMFAGERRKGDIQECLEQLMGESSHQLLMLSVDLAMDARWDFTNPSTYHSMMQLAREGLIDIWLGGPPCSTVARSRHVYIRNGPRPLRFRWCLWGRSDLRWAEQQRVDEANRLWINFWSMADEVCSHGGAYLMEHPADPGMEPYPSIWILPEVLALERRANADRAILHQCAFGGIAPKLTCLSGNVVGLSDLDGIRCPGISPHHQHGISIGRCPEGGFYTRRLQTYPPALCLALANLLLNTLKVMLAQNTGPTGALRLPAEDGAPRVTHWSTLEGSSGHGIALLNEASATGSKVQITNHQAAVYVHVDDTVCIGTKVQGSLHADSVLDVVVQGLTGIGFQVSQQFRSQQLEKVVGYEVKNSPAEFRLPWKKMVALRMALMGIAEQKKVNTSVLRSLVGIWIFGALLRRELLAIPHAVFHFMEEFEDRVVKWWPSARAETKAMGQMVPLMVCHVGSEVLPWLFATDAMGSNEQDHGGYGIAMTEVSEEEIGDLMRHGEALGRSVALKANGVSCADKPLRPTVPFTLLPQKFFEEDRWHAVDHGRWKYGDHITIGESRTVLKLLQRISSWPQLHGTTVFSLQDNQPTACAMSKGRSPSFQLNRVLRKKSATALAASIRLFLPWVESEKQPADRLSRLQ